MTKDMTSGNPFKTLFYFAFPMILGNIFQQLYSIVDSIIVGNFVGSDALAAVGASYPITFLFIAIASGLSIGASVVISQMFGAQKIVEMKSSIYTAIISISTLSIFLTILGLIFCNLILLLLKTPANILNEANIYLRIYILGLLPLFLYNSTTSIFNALGDSKPPLYFLIFSSILNVLLDFLFVLYFKIGVAGVAIATLIAQSCSAALSIFFLIKRIKKTYSSKKYSINSHESYALTMIKNNKATNNISPNFFDFKLLKKMSLVAIPTMIQQSIVSFGLLFVQALVNSYGSTVVSGYTAATKIDSIAVMPLVNISNAISTFAAQNIGAGLIERVKKGYKSTLIIAIIFCILITSTIYIFDDILIGMFISSEINNDVILVGVEYLRVVSLAYVLKGISGAATGVLKGSGDMKFFMISTLSNFSTRVIAAYALSSFIGEKSIWYSIPIGWFIEMIISNTRYFSGKWKDKVVITKKTSP